MFGSTHYHNHKTTIEEKKAPTDESMRLLKEMQDEAKSSILERGFVNIPNIKATIAYQKRMDVFSMMFDYRILINGKKVTASFEIEDEKDIISELIDRVANTIAIELIKDTYMEVKS